MISSSLTMQTTYLSLMGTIMSHIEQNRVGRRAGRMLGRSGIAVSGSKMATLLAASRTSRYPYLSIKHAYARICAGWVAAARAQVVRIATLQARMDST
jgi:hypothetical protein